MMKLALLALALLLLPVAGCDKKVQAPARKPVNVRVAVVSLSDAPLVVKAVGHVVAYRTVSVAPQVTGLLAAAHFADGAFVREGQKLFDLDRAPFAAKVEEARGALGRDWAKAAQSTRDYLRYKDLVRQGVVSQDDYEQRLTQQRSDWKQVQADQAALETARINLDYCAIVSPVTGVAGYQLIKPGNPVSAYTSTLVTLNQVRPILVRFSVSESELGLVRERYLAGKPLPVAVRSPKEEREVREKGRLTALDNAVDIQTGMISLQAEFQNPDLELWPGQYVQVKLTLEVQKDQLLMPSEALIRRQDGAFVFVAGEDGKAELRKVQDGRTVGESQVIVEQGLKQGDRVVTDGLVRLVPGAPVNVVNDSTGGGPQ
ncbi:efflux RND transporter periplasmic adaptor subunit [Fundidesulfovibrio butyratiphilus]